MTLLIGTNHFISTLEPVSGDSLQKTFSFLYSERQTELHTVVIKCNVKHRMCGIIKLNALKY